MARLGVFGTRSKGAGEKQDKQDKAGSPDQRAQLLTAADAKRDARDWPGAQEGYQAYLDANPGDAGIWVQYGHALKEGGRLAEAESAYRSGLEINPSSADTYLQLGHLHKIRGDISAAVAAYRDAVEQDPTLGHARAELRNLGFSSVTPVRREEARQATGPRILIDVSDLFFYLRHHHTVSGIQRVVLGIAIAIIEEQMKGDHEVAFISESEDRRHYVEVDRAFLIEIHRQLRARVVEHDVLKQTMASAIFRAAPYDPIPGDIILILGAFWVVEDIAERVIALRRQGVTFGALVHDIIPISHPEFCESSLTDTFTGYFNSVLSVADFILTVSDHSGAEVAEYMRKRRLPAPPIRTLPNAHITWEVNPHADKGRPLEKLLGRDRSGRNTPYVLYVSTVEIRKNHTYLFRIWKRLMQTMGENTPRLVFLGRPGWRVRDLMDQLASTRNLNGKVVVLEGLSDAELAQLYKGALFTVFPSFVEGWGLPVGESLAFGRPCLASNTSSIPEVGGEFVDYADPFDLNDGYEKVLRLIADDDYRNSRIKHIAEGFKPRMWQDVARDLITVVEGIVQDPQFERKDIKPPILFPGKQCRFGHGDDFGAYSASGEASINHFSFDTNWYPIENFGRWMRGRSASIRFAVPPGVEGPILILLELSTVGWFAETRLQVTIGDRAYAPTDLIAGREQYLYLEAEAIDGEALIELELSGPIATGSDPRQDLTLGARALTYAVKNDPMSRLDLLERLALQAANVMRPALQRHMEY